MSPHAAPRRLILAGALCAAAVLAGCASSAPVVYSKQRDAVPVDVRAQADIDSCRRAADQRVGRNGLDARQVAQRTASTAGVGFAAAAAGGLVARTRGAWEKARGAAAGGAAGMAAKLLFDWNEGDEVYQSYVERCLAARGHEVLGWR